MDNKFINGWIRQAKFRAKKYNLFSDLEFKDLLQILEEYNNCCAYCINSATTFDHPFPFVDKGPNTPANVIPICEQCKSSKRNNNIVWMFDKSKITNERYVKLLEAMLKHRGAPMVTDLAKIFTGL